MPVPRGLADAVEASAAGLHHFARPQRVERGLQVASSAFVPAFDLGDQSFVRAEPVYVQRALARGGVDDPFVGAARIDAHLVVSSESLWLLRHE
jgi:hypothetical protein